MSKTTLLFCGKRGLSTKDEIEDAKKRLQPLIESLFEEATSEQLNNCFTKSDFKNKQIKRFLDGK